MTSPQRSGERAVRRSDPCRAPRLPAPPQPPKREAVTFEERARAQEARTLEIWALAKAEAAARAIQTNRRESEDE